LKTVTKRLYEAMFLVDSAEAASDWQGIISLIETILNRASVEIVSVRKWDECKLAYEINGKSRGTYILCYFRVEGGKIHQIERDVNLSERIMRVLILNAEHLTQADLDKETPLMAAERKAKEAPVQADAEVKSDAKTAVLDIPEEIPDLEAEADLAEGENGKA
jgi:small subunit ribosomal protein S6